MQAFTPFLLAGIRNFQAETLCKVAVGVVVDICSGIGGQIQPFCDDIMGALMECLRDGSVQREIKPVVIACFGDVAMAICGAYEPYLPTSVMLLMQASTQRAPADDDELIDFVNSLRLSILEAYSGIIIGLSDGSKLHLFVTQLPNIMQFLEFLSREEALRDDDVLVKAVALIGDIGQQLGNQPGVRQQVQQQFVVTLITEAATCSDPSGKELATWTHGVLAGLGQ
jgi:importin subunit beta-1